MLFVVVCIVLLLFAVWWSLFSRLIKVFTAWDENNVPSSNSVELKSVSVVSFM